jgi:hypothetical protein
MALRPHSRQRRRGITAHNSISYSVYRRIITGWFLRTNVNPQHIYLLLHCRVDCKFAKENKKKLGQLMPSSWNLPSRSVRHPVLIVSSLKCITDVFYCGRFSIAYCVYKDADRLCSLVVRVPVPEVPSSILGTIMFSEKLSVWNGAHSASWG